MKRELTFQLLRDLWTVNAFVYVTGNWCSQIMFMSPVQLIFSYNAETLYEASLTSDEYTMSFQGAKNMIKKQTVASINRSARLFPWGRVDGGGRWSVFIGHGWLSAHTQTAARIRHSAISRPSPVSVFDVWGRAT